MSTFSSSSHARHWLYDDPKKLERRRQDTRHIAVTKLSELAKQRSVCVPPCQEYAAIAPYRLLPRHRRKLNARKLLGSLKRTSHVRKLLGNLSMTSHVCTFRHRTDARSLTALTTAPPNIPRNE